MIKDPLEFAVQLENVALKDLKVLLERLVKWDKGGTVGVGQQGPISPQGSTGPSDVQGAKGDVELVVSKVLLESKDLLVLLGDKANVA